MHASGLVLVALAALVSGCTTTDDRLRDQDRTTPSNGDDDARVERDYLVLTIKGNLTQVPASDSEVAAACGRPTGSFSGLNAQTGQLVLERGRHDLDWNASWIVVFEHLETHGDSFGSSCDFAWLFSAEGAFPWSFGGVQRMIGPEGDGLKIDDVTVPPGASHTLHIDTPGPAGGRYVGDVVFAVIGPWNTSGVIEIRPEDQVNDHAVDHTGWWQTTRP